MEQTNLNIGTIGQKLESARLAKGVSVSQAGQATKILSKFIEAMESDDFGALSAPVYAKSFIKMYASYLGLDANPLVDEYVAQHAPKAAPQLSDEVRHNLTKVDQVPMESADLNLSKEGGRSIFGEVNEALFKISGKKISLKMLLMAGGGVLLMLTILASATQCSDEDEDATATAGGAASVERELITEGTPDVYLVSPGVVEIGK
jgi:hypothetical protein